jgi:hypothetical protein
MLSRSTLVAACYSRACAPPPVGQGGSSGGSGLSAVAPVVSAIRRAGGTPVVVGGFVRDKMLGLDSKDIDIEVHGIEAEPLIRALKSIGKVDEVGKSFGVLKVKFGGEDLDISLPRTDSKTGEGHTGFDVSVDPHMGIEKALSRRDFTINAMGMDPDTGQLIDPFGGASDMKGGVLRAVSDAFSEDPLRVMRAVQFASRFGMRLDDKTAKMSRDLLPEIDSLPKERIWGEWEKIGMKGNDFVSLHDTITRTGLQGRFGEIRPAKPDLSGLSGDRRVGVVLAAVGADPAKIGATNAVTKHVEGIRKGLAFTGSDAESRAFARTLGTATFSDVARIDPSVKFDPVVADGPTKPLVGGSLLTEIGMSPGPQMGEAIRRATAAQDRGEFTTVEDAKRWLQREL